MKLILGRPKRLLKKGVFLAIGVFDGVHRGHRHILERVVKEAKINHSASLLISFFPYPQDFFGRRFPGYLTTLEEKVEILSRLGLDYVWIMPFNRRLYRQSGEDFINYVGRFFPFKKLFVGKDFRFGYGQKYGIRELKGMSVARGFSLEIIKPLKAGGRKVSSSLIRSLIKKGEINRANRLLGYAYGFKGRVKKFRQLAGRILGFPTANLEVGKKLLPPEGVYAVRVSYNNKLYEGAANIGRGETLYLKEKVLEVHILGFRKNIYNKTLQVVFAKKIRDERLFLSPEGLKNQIKKDIAAVRKYFSRHKISYISL